jgi:hypothetical protein
VRIAVGMLVLALLGGCMDDPAGSVIDGWAIGEPVTCDEEFACDRFARAAITELDRRYPAHPPIVTAVVHRQARIVPRSGGEIYVVVIELGDGSARAFGVGGSGIEPELVIFHPP